MYSELGRFADAAKTARRALAIAERENDAASTAFSNWGAASAKLCRAASTRPRLKRYSSESGVLDTAFRRCSTAADSTSRWPYCTRPECPWSGRRPGRNHSRGRSRCRASGRNLRICEPGLSMDVTTFCPSGEIWDMKPNLLLAFSSAKELQRITSSLRIEVAGFTKTMPYKPLSLPGPSTFRPIVFPSIENEWQSMQVGRPCIISRLLASPT